MKMNIPIINKIKSPLLRYSIVVLSTTIIAVLLFVCSINLGMWGKIPNTKTLSNFQYQIASEVFTADSVLIGKYYLNDRQPVTYAEFPDHLIYALVAIEDQRFYEHSGVDITSLARVGLKTVVMGNESSGGGSTITQQLAKNIFPRRERVSTNIIVDKIKEMIMARRLENIYDKQEIITHYLNTVSFGDNTLGIESASLKFFNTRTKDLTLPQAATLVGMLKATYGYNPRLFPEKSTLRRNLVLSAMKNNEYIDEEAWKKATKAPLELDYTDYDYNSGLAPYFREEVRKQLLKWTKIQNDNGTELNIYTSGLKIYTTLNFKMQQMAENVMKEHMSKLQNSFERIYVKNAPWIINKELILKKVKQTNAYKKYKNDGLNHDKIIDSLSLNKRKILFSSWEGDKEIMASTIDSLQHYLKFLNTGSLSLNPKTGEVLTWIGGINFKHYKYDHISQSKRQVGSTFKPIVYTAALENGIAPCTYFSAQEVEYNNLEGWSPSNSGNKDEAYLNYSMEEGLSNSVNTIAVKVLEKTGIENVLVQAKKMGIQEKLPSLPSLALGTGEIKMTELAKAYTSYLNNGTSVEPYLISTITTRNDSVLAHFEPKMSKNTAFTKENGEVMIEMMKATINSGTASRIRNTYGLKNDIAGKTGTTQNNKDAWFVALSPRLLHLTWVGLDEHEIGFKNTNLGQGANAALPMYALLLQKMNKEKSFNNITTATFQKPSAMVQEMLDCEPIKKDGFFKRLFKNPNKKRSKRFKNQ